MDHFLIIALAAGMRNRHAESLCIYVYIATLEGGADYFVYSS